MEVQVGQDGQKNAASIVVADSGNNRVLLFEPLSQGFQPEAVMTSSPGRIPNAANAKEIACVPEATPTACLTPK